jgi:branched-subunit amino acid ABC-type transport system permease component
MRIVNLAHGSYFLLGSYVARSVIGFDAWQPSRFSV